MKLAQSDNLNRQTSVEQDPSQSMELQESTDQLARQIARLSDNQQEVLRLKFQGGLSYQEIADVTGLTRSNVGFLLHTAIGKLRQMKLS